MTSPQPPQADGEAVAALTTGLAGAATTATLAALLVTTIGVSPFVAAGVIALIATGPRIPTPVGERTSAALYLVNACRRVTADVDAGTPLTAALAKERTYALAHKRARRARGVAMARVRSQARTYGKLLGWYATVDRVTSTACRIASGKNFDAVTGPHPGTLHGGSCRCRPGKPHNTSALVSSAWVKAGLGNHAEGAA
jgi:hypothetical protein